VSRSSGHGHSDGSLLLPSRASFSRSAQTGDSRSTSESESVSASVSTSTAWGMTTSKAAGDSESLALALQRSREFLVEQHELQQLPASAMIITYAGPAGRQVVLADTNPGIGALATATPLTLEESRERPTAGGLAGVVSPRGGSGGLSPPPREGASGVEAAGVPAAGRDAAPGAVNWRSGPGRPPPNLGPPPPRLDWRKRGS
jgi:hypothetical protein